MTGYGILTLLLAGSFLFPCGRVKQGVIVDGVAVGGLPYAEAERRVRERIENELAPLTVHTPRGDFTFRAELSFTDDVSKIVRRAKKGQSLNSTVVREWADAEEQLEEICELNAEESRCAEVSFSRAGFRFTPEANGIVCDYRALLSDALTALKEGGTDVTLKTCERPPEVTEAVLRGRTRLLSKFTTRFDGSNIVRAGNIRLACTRIAGSVLPAGGEFSFNRTVGKRTKENGFGEATVIFDGEFVQGVGGGVCQASTTLFNAALRAGLEITESRNHSLSVGYVSPSLDAMVSEYSDLKLKNNYPFPVYIQSRTGRDTVTFEIYGAPDGKRYETESVILRKIPPEPPKTVEREEAGWIRAEKEGMVSESYLLVYGQNGELLSRTLLRRDHYAAQQGIYGEPPPAAEEPAPEGGGSDGIQEPEGEAEKIG